MASISIIKGNSSQIFEVSVSGVTNLTGYTCRLVVVKEDKAGDTVHMNREIITTGAKFSGFILPAESLLFPLGSLKLVIEVSNAISFYKKEVIYDLDVRKNTIPSGT